MKRTSFKLGFVCVFAASSCVFAQAPQMAWMSQTTGAGPVTLRAGGFLGPAGAVVQGAPYSATITNESVQTLADGNRIVQNVTGTIARDSQGRTRQDTALPPLGNLAAANAPHLVFIHDPVAQTSYVLNLTDKTAQKMAMPPMPPWPAGEPGTGVNTFFIQAGTLPGKQMPDLPPLPPPATFNQKIVIGKDEGQATSEDLGSQVIEGVFVTGVRTTRTIPAGQIGNDKPISIVTEVWTSPDLKTIIYSKREDPRTGEQTFRLTKINRSEPDPTLFGVPGDFKLVDGPKPIIYRSNQ